MCGKFLLRNGPENHISPFAVRSQEEMSFQMGFYVGNFLSHSVKKFQWNVRVFEERKSPSLLEF